jgi:hypothetical protein
MFDLRAWPRPVGHRRRRAAIVVAAFAVATAALWPTVAAAHHRCPPRPHCSPAISPTPTPTPTPTPDAGGTWGGFRNPDALPPAGWRPYMDAAAWNVGTASATVHPNSAAMVAYLADVSGGRMQNIEVGPPGGESGGGSPLYFADSDDPLYQVYCRLWTSACEVHGMSVRIPVGALPTPLYDRHLTTVQPDGTEVDLWQSDDPNGFGGPLYVSHGGATRIDGDSTGSNATAAVTGAIAGQFRSQDWIAGRIPHALALTIYRTKAESVYPVRTDDCRGHLATTDPASPVPNGQWFRLNVTDAFIAAQPPWRAPLYRALRDFGGFVVDTGGSGFALAHQQERTYTSWLVEDPAYDWLAGQPGVDLYQGEMVAKDLAFPFDRLVALNPPPEARPCTPGG